MPEKPKNETTYVVGKVNADGSTLTIVGDTLANGPEQAVRRVAEDEAGNFVAVPGRNWTIVGQEAEVPPPVIRQTVRKWGEGLPETAEETAAAAVEPESRRAEMIAAPHPAEMIEEDGA